MSSKTYFIKVALRGISPMIWRRLRIPGKTSLAKLHQAIQIAYSWDDEYLHQFHIYGKDYGISYEGGLCFADNAHKVYLDDFEFDVGDKFTYEYNFFEHCIVDIRIEDIKADAAIDSIYCLKGSGMPGAQKFDEIDRMRDLLKVVVKSNDKTTWDDITPYIDALNAVWFNRRRLNKILSAELH